MKLICELIAAWIITRILHRYESDLWQWMRHKRFQFEHWRSKRRYERDCMEPE